MPVLSADDGLRLLALDAGGLRALAQALIIRELLRRWKYDTGSEINLKVSECFDMIGGSGFGGLLAIMGGVLDMDGEQLVDEFVQFCRIVFASNVPVDTRMQKVEEEVKRMVREYSGDLGEGRMLLCEDSRCKAFVCASSNSNMSLPRVFRTYRVRASTSANEEADIPVWKAAHLTTSILGIMGSVFIDSETVSEEMIGSEVMLTNPTHILTEEAVQAFPNHHISCIVSIGSGHLKTSSTREGSNDLFRLIMKESQHQSQEMFRRFEKTSGLYWRLDVEKGFQYLETDNVENLETVIAPGTSYLRGSTTDKTVDTVLKALTVRERKIPVAYTTQQIPEAAPTIPPSATYPPPTSLPTCPPPTKYFIGRRIFLDEMRVYFELTIDGCHICVVFGLGGAGKTQLVLKFVSDNRQRLTRVFFLDASDRVSLEAGLKSIGTGIAEPSVASAISYLESAEEEWLLVFDNADDLSIDLTPYVQFNHGNIIITTRNRNVSSLAPECSFEVGKLEEDEAAELLTRGIPNSPGSGNVVTLIVQELGYLALAISQARAYIFGTHCGFQSYYDLFRENRQKLLSTQPKQRTDLYSHTVWTTWRISFDKLSQLAKTLLQLLSFMHHDQIPLRLFELAQTSLSEREDGFLGPIPRLAVDFLSQFWHDSTWDSLRFHEVLQELSSFSFISHDFVSQSLSIHPLVQEWSQEIDRDNLAASRMIVALAVPFGSDSQAYSMQRSLIPHLLAHERLGPKDHFELSMLVGKTYREWGELEQSRRIFEDILRVLREEHGLENKKTMEVMHQLGWTLGLLGRNKESLDIVQQVVDHRTRLLGPKHIDTLSSTHSLAAIFGELGRYDESWKLCQEVVEARERTLGPEHIDTLSSMDSLAWALGNLERYDESFKLYQGVFEARKRISGTEHIDTLQSTHNLAGALGSLGRYDESLRLYEEVLEARKRILGPEHIDTLLSMDGLAWAIGNLGRHDESLELYRGVVEVQKRILGPDHVHTLLSKGQLALALYHLLRYEQAMPIQENVLALRKRVSGSEHPDTMTATHNLAWTYHHLKRTDEAVTLMEEAVDLRTKILGPDHPYTISSVDALRCFRYPTQEHSQIIDPQLFQEGNNQGRKMLKKLRQGVVRMFRSKR